MTQKIENVFVTEGVPEFTFVPPPNYNDILIDIRRPQKPVIIEGQSGSGKTTCVKKIIADLADGQRPIYYSVRSTHHQQLILELATTPKSGTFVIDDFHRLPQEIRDQLANIAKLAAEQANENSELPKLILIGINEIGSDLIQLVPDIAKRIGIHKINPGSKQDVDKLIRSGSEALNITIKNSNLIYEESRGDYWLTQQLCQQVCLMNNVTESLNTQQELVFELGELRLKVISRLKAHYYADIKEFCRGQRFRPSNDPYYKLLRAVSSQDKSVIDLNDLANTTLDARGSINNIKERRLTELFRTKPACARSFYYNVETKTFAIEDAALFYFLIVVITPLFIHIRVTIVTSAGENVVLV